MLFLWWWRVYYTSAWICFGWLCWKLPSVAGRFCSRPNLSVQQRPSCIFATVSKFITMSMGVHVNEAWLLWSFNQVAIRMAISQIDGQLVRHVKLLLVLFLWVFFFLFYFCSCFAHFPFELCPTLLLWLFDWLLLWYEYLVIADCTVKTLQTNLKALHSLLN